MKNELISPTFRIEFREFCVDHFVLRQIDDCFKNADIKQGAPTNTYSGQRRTRVEGYYSTINWEKSEDVEKFLVAVQIALSQTYVSEEGKKRLQTILENEGFIVEKMRIKRKINNSSSESIITLDVDKLIDLTNRLISLDKVEPQKRGYEFERFLADLFQAFALAPRGAFKLLGEQIDGSFQLGSDIYLVEAKWESRLTSQSDLLILKSKVESKATWTRGLFVSYTGFSDDGLEAYSKGRATNIIGMTGQDIYFILSKRLSLTEIIMKKVRAAAETGHFYTSVMSLLEY